MKPYHSPGACSLAPHICLHESGLPFQAIPAPTKMRQLPGGSDCQSIIAIDAVPLLELYGGTRLTEGPAIVQHLADQVPAKKLAPSWGSMERYRLMSRLNFTGTDLHRSGLAPLFNPAKPDVFKALTKDRLCGRLRWANEQLEGPAYLMGNDLTVADACLFTLTGWVLRIGVDLSGLASLIAYRARVAARPAVQAAMKSEGLI